MKWGSMGGSGQDVCDLDLSTARAAATFVVPLPGCWYLLSLPMHTMSSDSITGASLKSAEFLMAATIYRTY